MYSYKIIFYLAFIGFNIIVLTLVNHYSQCKCIIKAKYSDEKYMYLFNKIKYLQLSAMTFIGISVVNMCLPLTSTLGKIILIGNIVAIAIIIGLIIQLNILVDLLKKVDSCEKKCKAPKIYTNLKDIIIASSTGMQLAIAFSVLMGLLYL